MEIDQIVKQVDWLDDERRKDKTVLKSLEERLVAVEGNVPPLAQQVKELNGEITRLSAVLARMDTYDEAMLQQRIEAKQNIDELEGDLKKRVDEIEKIRRVEMRALDTSLAEMRKELEPIPELRRALKARVDEEARLAKMIDEVRAKIDVIRRSDEEYTRTYRLMDDGRRQDAKRLTDLQGEVTAIRKRVDEQRGYYELSSSTIKKLEIRLSELSMVETERRDVQAKFLETQALHQVERDRTWKEWEARFDVIENQTGDIESHLLQLDETHRAVKRSQENVDELAQKVDRRINELSEVQRLSEERFRQEWVTFKADDQKRWTNYTLTLEEQRNETARLYEKLTERVTHLEDMVAEMNDMLKLISDQTEKRLQSLLAVAHEWVEAYDRTFGRARP